MRPLRYFSQIAGAALLGILSSHSGFAQSVSIEVTTTKQQTFQGFGAEISDTLGTFLPRGGRADKPGSTAAALYDKLLSPNSQYSLKLSFLRLDLPTELLQRASGTAFYDFPTAIVKTGQADIIKAAKSRNPNIRLCFVPGTPPFWMKENGANYDLTVPFTFTFSPDAPTANRLLASQQANYANLLGKFCTDFNTYFKYPLDALSLQNEPEVNANYNSCLYPSNSSVDPNAATFTSMVTALRQVAPFSYWSLPQLWGPDYGDTSDPNYPEYIADAADLGLLNALSVHSYGSVASGLPSAPGDYHRNNLPVHMTEYSLSVKDPNNQINGVASEPLMAAKMTNEFCKDANDGQVASWFWFRCLASSKADTGECLIAANTVNNNPNSVYKYIDVYNFIATTGTPVDHALIALNDNTKYPATGGPYATISNSDFSTDWTLTSKYYAFRRLTRSVLPGSVSMKTKTTPNYASASYQDDVYSAAFLLPSGKYCIVIANQSGTTHTVNLKVDGLKAPATTGLTAYYTAPGSNDVSWPDQLTKGAITTTAWPYSVLCFVQK